MEKKVSKSRNSRYFFTMNNARIEEIMNSGASVKSAYYTLISEGKNPDFTLESFRAGLKRHRPDLHQLIAYGNTHTLSPVSTPAIGKEETTPVAAVSSPVTRAWKHNKTPDEALFQKTNKD